jgi:hypothetical protein
MRGATGRSLGHEQVRKRLFGAVLYLKPGICQDRLGTNIGYVEKMEAFLQARWVWRMWGSIPSLGCKAVPPVGLWS